jgi:hypothetical protein
MARSCTNYLLTLSNLEFICLSSLPIDLGSCKSFPEMIPLIFKMYSIESSLYRNVNHFLRKFPIQILSKFLKELDGMLRYIYLLQSSIHDYAFKHSIAEGQVVYRGLPRRGSDLGSLYASLIGQIIVWKGFTSTSSDITCVMDTFVGGSEGILFEITLCAGAVATALDRDSTNPTEYEVLIAAMSGFMVNSIDYIPAPQSRQGRARRDSVNSMIPKVTLCYWLSWFDFDTDNRPPILIV